MAVLIEAFRDILPLPALAPIGTGSVTSPFFAPSAFAFTTWLYARV